MKLVINVDNYKIEACKRRKEEEQNTWYHDMVLNGKPLEKEIVKELEKIKKEIMKYSAENKNSEDLYLAGCGDGAYHSLAIIDKYISELKGDNK